MSPSGIEGEGRPPAPVRVSGWPEVLVVSPDGQWTSAVAVALRAEGHVPLVDASGSIALDRARLGADLVIVDMAILGTGPGLRSLAAVVDGVRARRHLPIVVVDEVSSGTIVLGAYEAGADLFVPKSTTARELTARARALLRRFGTWRREVIELASDVAPIVLDPVGGTVTLGGVRLDLSEREFDAFHLLVRRPGHVVTRAELVARQSAADQPGRTLDFVIRRLREKLEAVDGVRRIEVMRGVGFRFVVDGALVDVTDR